MYVTYEVIGGMPYMYVMYGVIGGNCVLLTMCNGGKVNDIWSNTLNIFN